MSENLLDEFLKLASKATSTRKLKDTDIFSKESDDDPSTSSKLIHTGDTDSSDDEDNKYYEQRKYNDCGKEIKHLLRSVETAGPQSTTEPEGTWKSKPKIQQLSVKNPPQPPKKLDVYADPIFGLRIVQPLVSFTTLQEKMLGRDAVNFQTIKKYVAGNISEKNWVLAGIIVGKSPVKTSQKGNQFLIWTLSDLKFDIKTVSVFLFGSAYKQLWKTPISTVVGILNPSVMSKTNNTKDEVCRKFNEIGSRLLSRGFIQLEKKHAALYKQVKSLLPRRESERRVHVLSRHCDILQAVETRISMLNMTYMKYIESNLLCFIPGKVLDEMKNVLNYVQNMQSVLHAPRTHQVLQELRDLSSMAMEHFDEHILPRVKEHKEQMDEKRQTLIASFSGSAINVKQTKPFIVQQVNDLQKIRKQYKTYKHHIAYLNQNTQKLIQKMKKQNKRLKAQSVKIREQERKIQEQSVKIQEQESALADIKKHMDEWDQKYKDLTTELVRARDYILLKTTSLPKSSSTSLTRSSSPPKIFKSSVKPPVPRFLLKSYAPLHLDVERKRKSNLLPDIPVKISRSLDEIEDKSLDQLLPIKEPDKGNDDGKGGGNFSFLFETLIKTPLTGIKSRKRKIAEEIDLK